MIRRTLATALALLAAPAAAQDSYFETWEAHREELEAQGLTRGQWLIGVIYAEFVHISGLCRNVLPAAVAEDPLEMLPADLPARPAMEAAYQQALDEAASDPPSSEGCARMIDGWMAEQAIVMTDPDVKALQTR